MPFDAVSTTTKPQIAPVFRRFFAYLVDMLLLTMGGVVLSHFFFDQLVALGQITRLIGAAIFVSYFGVLDSSLTGGRSPGKWLLRIRVVANGSGKPVSPVRTALRCLVLAIPTSLNGITMPTGDMALNLLIGAAILGLGGSILYLFAFNRRTRQSAHDLLTRTLVVRSQPSGPLTAPPIWRGHFVAIGVCTALVMGGLFVGVPYLAKLEPFASMATLQEQALTNPHVRAVGTASGVSFKDGKQTRSWVTLSAILTDPKADVDQVQKDLARQALSSGQRFIGEKSLQISLRRGFDLGFYSSWRTLSVSHSPEEWRRLLGL